VTTRWWAISGLVCLMLFAGCGRFQKSSSPAGFEALFDGETFDGWEGNLEVFRIEGNAVVGGSLEKAVEHNDFLCTEKEYGDFELRLQVKLLGEQANAGIQFRTKRIPDHYEVSGYQADMGQQYWGCLYDESRRNKVLAGIEKEQAAELVRAGQWNDYIIRCQGDRIQLWLNGTLTVDYTETDPAIERTGIIALQIHGGPPSEAWYRNIRIKTLN
jgi:3-keto-disaccharide hydrolase